MFACLFFGDSLALGTGAAVNARLPLSCEVRAREGAGSVAMLGWSVARQRYDTAILSIGSNDDIGLTDASPTWQRAFKRISRLRSRTPSRRCLWLLPYEPRRAALVRRVAATFGDEIVELAGFPSNDGVHPVSYRTVAGTLLR